MTRELRNKAILLRFTLSRVARGEGDKVLHDVISASTQIGPA